LKSCDKIVRAHSNENVSESQTDLNKQILNTPFDFTKIRVVINRPKERQPDVIYLDRAWSRANIPHFRGVIDSVKANEGIEITLSCNLDAFKFAIEYLNTTQNQ
jgi:hypothetical protein